MTNDALDRDLQIDVLPLAEVGASSRYFMIVFQAANQAKGAAPALTLPPAPLTEDEKDALSAQLRLDLSTTRFHLQSLIEERDAHNQELVSANEEIQSANEELQSSNEELETTKEELQSANEELQTVNEELQQRNLVLTQTGNDLSNLLNSVNIPLLMLTSDLKIRQFTPPMQRLLNVREADIGRSISEIRLQLSVEDIEPILLDVLDTLATREIEVQDRDGKWNLLRVRPYRTAENHIEGLVVVLVDIDQLRRSQQDLLESRDFVSSVVESVPVPIVVLNKDCTIRTNNTAFRELARTQGQDLRGRSLPDLVNHNWGIDGFVGRLNELLASNGSRLEFEHHSTTSDRKILLIKGQALFSGESRIILLLIEDITARRDAEDLLAKQKLELEEKVVTAAHALDRSQEELRGLTGYLFTVQEEERQRVSRELHDDVSQRLSFLELMLNDGKQDDSLEERERKTSALREHIQTLNTDVRQISHRLHPALLDDLGLSTALRALVQEFGEREGMPSTFIAQEVPDLAPQQATIAIYRITQEALRNVAKHAGKTHVKVVLKGGPDSLHLEVVDLGVGFDQESDLRSDGLGIISMQERARLAQGTFSIESTLGMGTKVVVVVPLVPHA
jgi:two-component system CheB/CheR fusion protein